MLLVGVANAPGAAYVIPIASNKISKSIIASTAQSL